MTLRRRLGLTLIPLGFLAGTLGLLYALAPEHVAQLPGYMAFAFVVAGKFIVLAPLLQEGVPYGPYYLAAMIALMDVTTALFVVLHLDVLYRLPWIGRRLRGMEEYGRRTLEEKPWYRRWAIGGVAVFVMFPLTGTGAIGGTLFGRLIGLRPMQILAGIAAGAFAGSFGMAIFADVLARVLAPIRDTLGFKIVSAAVVGAFLLILIRQALKSPPASLPPDAPARAETGGPVQNPR